MDKKSLGWLSVVGVAVIMVAGIAISVESAKTPLAQYKSKAVIEHVEKKETAVIVDGYKIKYLLSVKSSTEDNPDTVVLDEHTNIYQVNNDHKEKITLDQLQPDQTIDMIYEYPNDHLIRASEISVVSNR
ncbi:hypothetical protein [Saccharibacillus sp. JS10]|uniref:hypothetical protein n=1 Tax=Saccharibacillus sp. JS10 TaxID=2950552 RepID=UPI00210B5499|nr:hypothetical protein [Saccharibacillus sp. JS10]MCQ4087348.1 hypothetical protein [Saccharibacillus sp. JS10]